MPGKGSTIRCFQAMTEGPGQSSKISQSQLCSLDSDTALPAEVRSAASCRCKGEILATRDATRDAWLAQDPLPEGPLAILAAWQR